MRTLKDCFLTSLARILSTCPAAQVLAHGGKCLLCCAGSEVSAIDDNDDAVHGLGNEFSADTKNGKGDIWNWHDAAEKMTHHCSGSANCKIIGKDCAELRVMSVRVH